MKLLIVTQVIDVDHPILGFFHRWVEEFAKHGDQVHVIALQVGTYDLPSNVTVHSLGKEVGRGRFGYTLRFCRLLWSLRREYDAVFVHMNQVYVLLGALIWKTFRKRVSLWYTHGTVSLSLRVAERFVDVIFTAAQEGFNLKSKKVIVTGHGIDTDRFAVPLVSKDLDLITVGRVTRSKNLTVLIEILTEVRKTNDVSLTIVGDASSEADTDYKQILTTYLHERGLDSSVKWYGTVAPSKLPALLSRASIFVTSAQNGSLDKAILEAMAAGLPVVSSAAGSLSLPLGECQVTTPESFVLTVKKILDEGAVRRSDYATYVREHHSLQSLIPRIIRTLQ